MASLVDISKHLRKKNKPIHSFPGNKEEWTLSNLFHKININIPLISMDRSSRYKINQETMASDDTLDQMDFINIHRTLHAKQQNTFFSTAHGTFSRADHIRPQSNYQWIQEDWNHTKHLFQPQQCETVSQLQGKNWLGKTWTHGG